MPALRKLSVIALSLLLVAAVQAQNQGQWKWRDAQGNIQYSDRPPPMGTPDKDILARPLNAKRPIQLVPYGASAPASDTVTAAAPASTPKPGEAMERARVSAENDAKLKAEQQRVAKAQAENCQAARSQLATLESGVRMSTVNDKGDRVILDEAGRAQEIARAKAVIASDCK